MPAKQYDQGTGFAKRKLDRLQQAKTMLLENPGQLTFTEISDKIGIDRTSGLRYMKELGATADNHGRYTYSPTPEDIRLAKLILGE